MSVNLAALRIAIVVRIPVSGNRKNYYDSYDKREPGFSDDENKNNNVFREILKCFRKTAKFEFFAKKKYIFGISRSPASK